MVGKGVGSNMLLLYAFFVGDYGMIGSRWLRRLLCDWRAAGSYACLLGCNLGPKLVTDPPVCTLVPIEINAHDEPIQVGFLPFIATADA
mmetsp:Transcript_16222/g.24011  ORF Transcript_16222/g.24011 Transcript_16222/m.24011 type:complete len:89 (-) Transcript_16222:330-596(-)